MMFLNPVHIRGAIIYVIQVSQLNDDAGVNFMGTLIPSGINLFVDSQEQATLTFLNKILAAFVL